MDGCLLLNYRRDMMRSITSSQLLFYTTYNWKSVTFCTRTCVKQSVSSNADILLETLPKQLILYLKNSHHATDQTQHSLSGISFSFSPELYTASNNSLLSI